MFGHLSGNRIPDVLIAWNEPDRRRDGKIVAFENVFVRLTVFHGDDGGEGNIVVLGIILIHVLHFGLEFLDRQFARSVVVFCMHSVVGVHANVGSESDAILFHG